MAKKIDDILNPENEPNLVVERLVKVLRQSKANGLALTKAELFDADRVNWLDIAPIGEGGLLLTFLARRIDAETGISKQVDELRDAALEDLVKAGRVVQRESEGQTYYWLADTDRG